MALPQLAPAQLAPIVLLGVIALTMISAGVISILRDADWWLVARGTARGRYERLRRALAARRG